VRKRVVITGGSRGIGAATAVEFAQHGWDAWITYRSEMADARRVAAACKSTHVDAVALRLDVTDDGSIQNLAAELAGAGGADVLVLNAGVIVWTAFSEQTFADVELQIRTNVEGMMKTALALFRHVRSRILVIGSDVATKPHSGLVVYSASKAAARVFALALARSSERPEVVCVNPKRTATAMNDFKGGDPAEVAAAIFRAATDSTLPNGSEIDVHLASPARG
jgi:3-oxoacyl-[acyl-carrier protein] reductase